MAAGIFIFLSLIFCILIALGVWLLIVVFKKEKQTSDSTIAINFLSHRANGRFLGIEKNIEEGKNGRNIITFEPKDVLISTKTKKEIEDEIVIVGKNKRLSFAKGKPSKERNIAIYLPIDLNDMPEEVKNSELGVALMFASKLKDVKDIEIEMLREGSSRKDEILKKIGDGEITKEFMTQINNLVKDFLKIQIAAKEEKNKSTLSNISSSSINTE